MHIVIFNGPPSTGKDTSATHLAMNHGFAHLEFKTQLNRDCAEYLCEEAETFDSIDEAATFMRTDEMHGLKEVVRKEYERRSLRQLKIYVSEDCQRENNGRGYYGGIAGKAVLATAGTKIAFSDGGFHSEVSTMLSTVAESIGKDWPFHGTVPRITVDIVRLHRDGHTFDDDSRYYLDVEEILARTVRPVSFDLEVRAHDIHSNDVLELCGQVERVLGLSGLERVTQDLPKPDTCSAVESHLSALGLEKSTQQRILSVLDGRDFEALAKQLQETKPVKDQHEKIKGYRDLSQGEIDLMNEVKEMSAKVGRLIEKLDGTDVLDKRWVAIARTDLQKGFMSAVRAIAQPESW